MREEGVQRQWRDSDADTQHKQSTESIDLCIALHTRVGPRVGSSRDKESTQSRVTRDSRLRHSSIDFIPKSYSLKS